MNSGYDLYIQRGATLRVPFLFQQPKPSFRDIQAFERTAPIQISCATHGVPNDWPIWLEDVTGANASLVSRPRPQTPIMCEAPDADTLVLPGTNGKSLTINQGTVVYLPPVIFGAGTTAFMRFFDPAGAQVLELTEIDGLVISEQGRITVDLDNNQTQALTWDNATYELDITFPDATVVHYDMGNVMVAGRQP